MMSIDEDNQATLIGGRGPRGASVKSSSVNIHKDEEMNDSCGNNTN